MDYKDSIVRITKIKEAGN